MSLVVILSHKKERKQEEGYFYILFLSTGFPGPCAELWQHHIYIPAGEQLPSAVRGGCPLGPGRGQFAWPTLLAAHQDTSRHQGGRMSTTPTTATSTSTEASAKSAQQRVHNKDCTTKSAQRRLHNNDCTTKTAQQRLHNEYSNTKN